MTLFTYVIFFIHKQYSMVLILYSVMVLLKVVIL